MPSKMDPCDPSPPLFHPLLLMRVPRCPTSGPTASCSPKGFTIKRARRRMKGFKRRGVEQHNNGSRPKLDWNCPRGGVTDFWFLRAEAEEKRGAKADRNVTGLVGVSSKRETEDGTTQPILPTPMSGSKRCTALHCKLHCRHWCSLVQNSAGQFHVSPRFWTPILRFSNPVPRHMSRVQRPAESRSFPPAITSG